LIAEPGKRGSVQPCNTSPSPIPNTTLDLDVDLDLSLLGTDLDDNLSSLDSEAVLKYVNLDNSLWATDHSQATGANNQRHSQGTSSTVQNSCNMSPTGFNELTCFSEATPLSTKQKNRVIRKDSILHSSQTPKSVSNYQNTPQPTKLNIDILGTWMRKLSELNVDLHQHLLSIPSTTSAHLGSEMSGFPQDRDKNMLKRQPLHLDRTFHLSQQYAEMLLEVFPETRIRQEDGSQTPTHRLDLAAQLLVLSSSVCLVDSYDKILQHIKEWTQLRLKRGACLADFPYLLPDLAIGVHRLPDSSLGRPLLLTCLIETATMQTCAAVSRLIKMEDHDGSSRGKSINDEVDGTNSVREISLQVITAKEEAVMELVRDIWKLATC
jgi:hypothetical protein